jgi:uncharacterized membrane protein (UPF0127 family)
MRFLAAGKISEGWTQFAPQLVTRIGAERTCSFRGNARIAPMARRVHLFIPFLAFTALLMPSGGCGRQTPVSSTTSPATVFGFDHAFTVAIGGQPVAMRLAVHDKERQHGLMNVAEMPENAGMLFLWTAPQRMSFYMRNCRFAQDIGYFDPAGTLKEIYPMYPGVEDSVMSSGSNLQFALEMNLGWYARHGVKPGAALDLVALREALRARGYDPAKFLPAPP